MIIATPVIAAAKLLIIFLKKKYEVYRERKEGENINKDESKI
jgi:hypothetical protein